MSDTIPVGALEVQGPIQLHRLHWPRAGFALSRVLKLIINLGVDFHCQSSQDGEVCLAEAELLPCSNDSHGQDSLHLTLEIIGWRQDNSRTRVDIASESFCEQASPRSATVASVTTCASNTHAQRSGCQAIWSGLKILAG